MYSDEDLNMAVKKGIFSSGSVEEFRHIIDSENHSPSVDEENFRLVGGFNDIFIVIACALLLFSSLWVLNSFDSNVAYFVFSALSWGLAEIFVLKRKMALPAIMLLLAFIGGVFMFSESVFGTESYSSNAGAGYSVIVSTALSALAAYCHWRRFGVPITVAVGAGVCLAFLVTIVQSVFPYNKDVLLATLFLCGCIAFICAMYWDSSDTTRTTRKSDIAFWLHLLSAPLIIHPVFWGLGVLDGNESFSSMLLIIVLYALMTSISIVIDRRAFMVSSLIYVIYALSSLIENYGGVGYSFALTGVVMGASLLLLSIYWQSVRILLLRLLPMRIQSCVPSVSQKKL